MNILAKTILFYVHIITTIFINKFYFLKELWFKVVIFYAGSTENKNLNIHNIVITYLVMYFHICFKKMF